MSTNLTQAQTPACAITDKRTDPVTLGAALDRPVNFLTPARLLMALGVVLGHSFVAIYGAARPEPVQLFNMTISYVAVNAFFILSGLLITRSYYRNPDLIRFVSARILRLFPALVVLALAAALVVGPLVTSLSAAAYFTDWGTWRYICDVLTFGDSSGGPPQIFANNPWHGEFSASLWTLRYEAMAYGGTVLIARFGLMRDRTAALLLFTLSVIAFLGLRALPDGALPDPFTHLTRFAMAYMLGATLYMWRDALKLDLKIALGVIAVALIFGPTASFEVVMNFALAAFILMVGFMLPAAFAPLTRLPDLSYGIYIWQWPVMQSLYHYGLARDPLTMLLMALPISAGIAALSWYLVEKPALRRKVPMAVWLKTRLTGRKTA